MLVNQNTNQLISDHRRYNTLKRLGLDKINVIYKSVGVLETIELIQSNRHRDKSMVEKVNEYRELKSQLKSLPMKKRKELMGSLKLREFLHKEIGISQTNDVRMKVVEDSGEKYYTLNKKQVTLLRLMVRNFLCLMNTNYSDTKEIKKLTDVIICLNVLLQ